MVVHPGIAQVALGTTFFLLVGVAICIAFARVARVRGALAITIATFGAHVLVSTAVYTSAGLFANDAFAYDRQATTIAERLGGSSTTIEVSKGKEGWAWTLGTIYHWFGHQPVLGLILNATLAAAIVPILGCACRQLGWEFAARPTMWIVGFAPPLFLWSSFLLREAFVNFAVSSAFAAAVAFLHSRHVRWLGLALLADLLLVWFRGPASVIVFAGLSVGIVLTRRVGSGRIRARSVIASIVVAALLIPLSLSLLGTFNTSIDSINRSRTALARQATTSFGDVSSASDLSGSALLSLKQFPSTLAGPFPWQWSGGAGGLLTAVDGLAWVIFVWYVVQACRAPVTRRGRWICLTPAAVLFMTIALTSGNFGTLVRIRAMALPLLVCLVAVGWCSVHNPKADAASESPAQQPKRAAVRRPVEIATSRTR